MAFAETVGGYTVHDLDWLRAELGLAGRLELDPWGSLIVTPAEDPHEIALTHLTHQAARQVSSPDDRVVPGGLPWKIPGGSGYTNVPDMMILAPDWHRVGELHLDPPPFLVVEIGSRSTRGVDRGRKLADYRLGGAGLYLLVDVPAPGSDSGVKFQAHDFATDEIGVSIDAIDLVVGGETVRFDLAGRTAVRRR